MFLVSCIFFSKCLYFSYYMAGYLLDRPCTLPFSLIPENEIPLPIFSQSSTLSRPSTLTIPDSFGILFHQCFLSLVSSSVNVSIFHSAWLATLWTNLIYVCTCVCIYLCVYIHGEGHSLSRNYAAINYDK